MQNISTPRHASHTPAASDADPVAPAETGADTPAAPAATLDALARSGRLPPGLTFLGDGRFEFDARAGDLPPLRMPGKAREIVQQDPGQVPSDAKGRSLRARQVVTVACSLIDDPFNEQPGGELSGRLSSIFVIPPEGPGALASGMQTTPGAIARGTRRLPHGHAGAARGLDHQALRAATRRREIEAQLLAQGFHRTHIGHDAPGRPWEPDKEASGYLKTFVDENTAESNEDRSAPGGASAVETAPDPQPVRMSSARARQRARDRKASSQQRPDPAYTWTLQIVKFNPPRKVDASPSGAEGKAHGGGVDQKVRSKGLRGPTGRMSQRTREPRETISIVVPHDAPPDWTLMVPLGDEHVMVSLNLEGRGGPSDPVLPPGVHLTSELLTERRVHQLLAEGYEPFKVMVHEDRPSSRKKRTVQKVTLYTKTEFVEDTTGSEADDAPASAEKPAALSRQQKATLRKRQAQRRAAARQPGNGPASTGTADTPSPTQK